MNNELLDKFLKQDKYLTEEQLKKYINKNNITLRDKEITKLIKEHNIEFLNNTLINKKEYFDNMFKEINPNIKLDKEQIKAIIADENLLVISGAGSGKTTTMAAKVKYLVDNGYKEESILVVSFTKKACEEIENIIHNDFKCNNVKVTTFHALGYDIIKKSGRDIDKIIEDAGKYKIISNFLHTKAFNDKKYLKDLLDAFRSYINLDDEALNYDTFTSYHEAKYKKRYQESNLNLSIYIKNIINKRRNYKKTIKGEILRSKEEVDIANFLYINNIDYSYELSYKETINKTKIHPDFFIKQLELEYYIEHFGVDQNLDNKMFDEKELKNYLKTLKLKQTYMNTNDNYKNFIVTYSKYKDDNINYLDKLREQLINKGYTLTRKTDEEIFKTLEDTDTDSYFNNFVYKVLMPFFSIFKTLNYHNDDFNELYDIALPEIKRQLIVIRPIFKYYQDELRKRHYIDFDDMINLAYEIIPTITEKTLDVDYQYLIIDEYQDISNQKYNLTKLFADLFKAKIMAVGDDWQTIYSFAGSDINLFQNFEEHVENAKLIPIKNTYRNSQELIDIAGTFIQNNKFLIKKQLKSTKHLANPIEVYYYEDKYPNKNKKYNKYQINNNRAMAITKIITEITKCNPNSKILLLGRYEKDKIALLDTDYFNEYRGKIRSTVIENANLEYLTIHKSKGIGADAVILVNAIDDILGFPSKVEDIPLIKLLKDYYTPPLSIRHKNRISINDNKTSNTNTINYNNIKDNINDIFLKYMYPEERRLFYVAMTRTKNKFYIAVPYTWKSIFIKEITKYNQVIQHKEIIKSNKPIETNRTCPKCNYKLNMINYKNTDFYIYDCSNKKCNFKTMFPKKLEPLENCPICGDIVIYCYPNHLGDKVYHCFNQECNYSIIKKD